MAFTTTLPVIVFLFQLAVVCTVSTLRQYSSFACLFRANSSFKKLYNITSARQNTLRIVWKITEEFL